MSEAGNTFTNVVPLLAQFGVTREHNGTMAGRYSRELDLWVVPTSVGEVPLIEATLDAAALATMTKIETEKDDHSFSLLSGAAGTHTATKAEGDDYSLATLAMATITEVKREADDLQ